MFINLHEFVLTKLAAREVPWTKVARETGMSYETLKKIASGRTPNPGVQHVQTLADYFYSRASNPIAQPLISTADVAQTAVEDMDSIALAEMHLQAGLSERRSLIPRRQVDRDLLARLAGGAR